MNTGSVNSFLDRFLGLADRGFGLIQGDVAFVLNALIVISVTLDTVAQIQSHLVAHQYEGLIKRSKLRGNSTSPAVRK